MSFKERLKRAGAVDCGGESILTEIVGKERKASIELWHPRECTVPVLFMRRGLCVKCR